MRTPQPYRAPDSRTWRPGEAALDLRPFLLPSWVTLEPPEVGQGEEPSWFGENPSPSPVAESPQKPEGVMAGPAKEEVVPAPRVEEEALPRK